MPTSEFVKAALNGEIESVEARTNDQGEIRLRVNRYTLPAETFDLTTRRRAGGAYRPRVFRHWGRMLATIRKVFSGEVLDMNKQRAGDE